MSSLQNISIGTSHACPPQPWLQTHWYRVYWLLDFSHTPFELHAFGHASRTVARPIHTYTVPMASDVTLQWRLDHAVHTRPAILANGANLIQAVLTTTAVGTCTGEYLMWYYLMWIYFVFFCSKNVSFSSMYSFLGMSVFFPELIVLN